MLPVKIDTLKQAWFMRNLDLSESAHHGDIFIENHVITGCHLDTKTS